MTQCFKLSVITKSSSDQFGVYLLAKAFSYFDILIWLPTLNLGYLFLFAIPNSIYVFDFTSTFCLTSFWLC